MCLLQYMGGDDSCREAPYQSVARPACQLRSVQCFAIPIAVPMYVQPPSAFNGYNGCPPQSQFRFEPSIHTKFWVLLRFVSQPSPASSPVPAGGPAIPSIIPRQPCGMHGVSHWCTCAAAACLCPKDSCREVRQDFFFCFRPACLSCAAGTLPVQTLHDFLLSLVGGLLPGYAYCHLTCPLMCSDTYELVMLRAHPFLSPDPCRTKSLVERASCV